MMAAATLTPATLPAELGLDVAVADADEPEAEPDTADELPGLGVLVRGVVAARTLKPPEVATLSVVSAALGC